MKVLALLEKAPGRAISEFSHFMVAEELAVWKAYRKGALREMYFQRDPLVVTLIFEVSEIAEVAHELEAFPLVSKGLLANRLVSLGPWLPLEKIFDASLTKNAFTE